MKKTAIYTLIVLLLISSVVVFGARSFKKGDTKQAAAVVNNISVKVEKAQATEKSTGLTYKADIEPFQEGIVSSKAAGKVLSIMFENGKVVKQGETLIVLDAQELNNQLAAAENQLKAAENQLVAAQISMKKVDINLANVKRSYDRIKTLYDSGAVPQATYEDAETALTVAQNDADAAKTNLETLKINIESSKIGIKSLKDSIANTVIKAPISGVMDEKGISLGQFVSPGVVLAKVKDISSIYAVIQVEQENINKVAVGQKALIRLEDSTDTAVEGVMESINVSADPSARVFKCKIKVNNENQLLRPGIFAKAEIVSDQKVQVVTVPIEAMAGNEGNYYAFVNENGVARKRTVVIGGIVKNSVEILSGIKADESVICTNVSTIQDGDKITVVTE